MFEHFHAGDDVKGLGLLLAQGLDGNELIVDRKVRFQAMQSCDLQGLFCQVYAGYGSAGSGQGFTQNSAAATYVEDGFAGELNVLLDIAKTERINRV